MSDTAQVPVQESVGAALRFVRENIAFIATAGAIGAAVSVALTAAQLAVPAAGMVTSTVSLIVQSFVYAALLIAVLAGSGAVAGRVGGDGWRVFGAMAVIGFFLFIVMLVVTIPVIITLIIGPLSAYGPALEAAGGEEAAVMEVMTRFAQEQPLAILVTCLFYAVIWYALTSRLYLAAPASVDQGRILTFETWRWTRGATVRITAARLLLLLPAYVLITALSFALGSVIGINPFVPSTTVAVAESNQIGFLAYVFVAGLLSFTLYSALEAGLSTYLYRGLKPADAPAPPV